MNRTSNQLQEVIGNGWSIHIYDSDRRLLFSLYPSHGWVFLAGVGLGFILALMSLNGQITAQSSSPISAPVSAPLNLD